MEVKKEKIIACSTIESKFGALALTFIKSIWIKTLLLIELEVVVEVPIIYCDNIRT